MEAANTYSIDFESSSSQYVYISGGNQTNLNITGDYTIEVWFKPETLGIQQFLVARDAQTNRAYDFWIGSDNKLYSTFFSNDSTHSQVRGVPSLTVGEWTHLAVVADVSGPTGQMYQDGFSITTDMNGTDATSIQDVSTHLYVGARNRGTPSDFVDGVIDEVRVWNTLRTGQEVTDDMSRELNGNETGLVGYWKFNNNLADSTDNNNDLTSGNGPSFSASTPFTGFTEVLEVRKNSNESLPSSTVLQNDDGLKLGLVANKTYIIDGVIFASSTSATPDIVLGFFGQTDVKVRIGYTNDVNEMVLDSGEESNRINLPSNTPTSIHVKGTVVTGSSSGDFQLKWAQATSNAAATTVMEGSYLRAEEI